MLEKKLIELLGEAENLRKCSIDNGSDNFYNNSYDNLSKFIAKKLNDSFFQKKNAKIIAEHFDKILPYIVSSNMSILLLNTEALVQQPKFKEKFSLGLKDYPYKQGIEQIFYNMWVSLGSDKFDKFVSKDILSILGTIDVNRHFYIDVLNRINEQNQKYFLSVLVENKADIPYSAIEYKGDNKQLIYDNLPLFIENSKNLYNLMNFVKDDLGAVSKVKEYIDSHKEKAIESIFCETDHLKKISDPTLKGVIKLIILDVMKNENVNFSDITYNGGGFSRVLFVGDKVIKIGDRITKSFPNNPYIVSPLLRKNFEHNNESCFMEVTERVDTSEKASIGEMYQLYKNMRDLGLIWTDIKYTNVGRLKKENSIHWSKPIEPSDETLELTAKRGNKTLKAGELVLLDADFIYDENDPDIQYICNNPLSKEFEERYQKEKRKSNTNISSLENQKEYDELEQSFHR